MVKRENLIDQKSPPRFLIRACSVLVELETAQSRMIPIFEQAWRRKDYASLIPSNCKFCVPPRGGTIHNFQQKNFARHRVFWRRPAYQGVEWASRGLQKSPGYTHENGAKPIDLNRLWIMDSERVLPGEMARFFLYYFAFQVNALIGLNSAKTSVTQPYFFFWASNTAFAVPLFTSRNCASPSRIA